MSGYDCMPRGLIYRNGLGGCATSSKLLWSMAAFNVWSAILSLILGHDIVRRRIPSCSCSKEWRPWSSVAMSMIHPVAMLVSTITIRVNGFYPSIALVFAIWTMRPRLVATPIWYFLSSCSGRQPNPYLWTFKDNVIEETLLNVLSLPFAILFITNRHQAEEGSGWCSDTTPWELFWNAFYIIAAAGVISLVLLACMIMHLLNRSVRKTVKYSPLPRTNGISRFWKWTLTIAGLNMFVAFVGQWLLWSTFIVNAGTDFCPGSLVGESVAWVVALSAIALGRPLVGGPGGS